MVITGKGGSVLVFHLLLFFIFKFSDSLNMALKVRQKASGQAVLIYFF